MILRNAELQKVFAEWQKCLPILKTELFPALYFLHLDTVYTLTFTNIRLRMTCNWRHICHWMPIGWLGHWSAHRVVIMIISIDRSTQESTCTIAPVQQSVNGSLFICFYCIVFLPSIFAGMSDYILVSMMQVSIPAALPAYFIQLFTIFSALGYILYSCTITFCK